MFQNVQFYVILCKIFHFYPFFGCFWPKLGHYYPKLKNTDQLKWSVYRPMVGIPTSAAALSGKTGSRSGYGRIWIRQIRIQIRNFPDLDPAKPDPDPEFTGFRSGKSGSGSGCCRILIWVFDVDLVFTCSITSGRLSSKIFFGVTRYHMEYQFPKSFKVGKYYKTL